MACIFLMLLMHKRAFNAVVGFSFLLYPVLILFISLNAHDRGILLYLVPYIAYPFYFLHSRKKIIPVFLFITTVFIFGLIPEAFMNTQNAIAVKRDYGLEITSFSGAVVLIFFSLFSIKYQIWGYQKKIKKQRAELKEKNAEMEAQQKKLEESNLIKDKLFSIIGHDLKTPIWSLSMLLDSEESECPEQLMREILPELRTELKKASELFENLLSWAKLQLHDATVSNEAINVYEITEKVSESLRNKATAKEVAIQNKLSSDTIVNADKSILEIVLRNIISNAIKFSSKNGSITINGNLQEEQFQIKITDNGLGISPESLKRIREKIFYTTYGTNGEKGTGLGLIICSDLIEKCNGKLSIDSIEGQGTTLSILLPQ